LTGELLALLLFAQPAWSQQLMPTVETTPSAGPAAQLAILYEEDPNDRLGKRHTGSIAWRTEAIKVASSEKSDIAVRANIRIPDVQLQMTLSFRRNTDPSLPASHTVELVITTPSNFAGGGIRNVPGMLMKDNEQARGIPLAGSAAKVIEGRFLVGLSNVAADRAKNIQMLKERMWFDIPMLYANGRRAILAVEKGFSGAQAFETAFAAWEQSAPGANGPPVSGAAQDPTPSIVFPTRVAPRYASEQPGEARRRTCLDQFEFNKAEDPTQALNGGLAWTGDGGYYAECDKRLKEMGG
jgi:hypothetical protein